MPHHGRLIISSFLGERVEELKQLQSETGTDDMKDLGFPGGPFTAVCDDYVPFRR